MASALDPTENPGRGAAAVALRVAAAKAGDEAAFRWLVAQHQDPVFRVALRLLRDREAAAEATQDAFVKAWRGLARFEARAQFSTWMYRIVVNVCNDRMAQRRTAPDIRLDELSEPGRELRAAGRDTGAASIEVAEGEQAFERALAGLSEMYRVAFVLRQTEDRSYDEIAWILGISVTNAKVRVHRAREMMVDALRQRGVL